MLLLAQAPVVVLTWQIHLAKIKMLQCKDQWEILGS